MEPAASSGAINWGHTVFDTVTGPGTILMCFKSNNASSNWRAFGSREDSSTGDGVYLLYDDVTNVTNGFNCGANNNNYRANSTSGILGTGSSTKYCTFGFSWDGTNIYTWANGAADKTVAAAFTPNLNAGRTTKINSFTAASDFLWAYAWNRVLTSWEVASITQNPWQIFTDGSLPLWVNSVGGGVNGTASGALVTTVLNNPTGTAVGDGIASGSINTIVLNNPVGSATGGGTASGTIHTVVLNGVSGSATADASGSGTIITITLTAPTGTASTGSGVTATGSINSIVLNSPTGSATGTANATATGSVHAVVLSAPTGLAFTGSAKKLFTNMFWSDDEIRS
jgi:hypothetical protein